MPKLLPLIAAVLAFAACSQPAPQDADTMERWQGVSFFDLEARTLEGEAYPLQQFAGRPVLVVNVASKCGYTPQYEGLQQLHQDYGERGLVVVGFPCNQFLSQEPGTPEQIRAFCDENYGVSFALMEKVEVLDGDAQSPIYGLLGTRTGQLPAWNFAKYLVAADGETVTFFGTKVAPDDPELVGAIEASLR